MKYERVKRVNKIEVGSVIDYNKSGSYKVVVDKDVIININSDGEVKLYLRSDKKLKMTINVESKASIYNLTGSDLVIDLNILSDVKVKLVNMNITKNKVVNVVNVYHESINCVSDLYCYGISYLTGDLKFIVNSYIRKNMTGVICNQVSRTINLDDATSLIEPNLFVDEFSALANHSAYTGPFNKDDLFYLKTKGISQKEAFNLLLKGFMKIDELPKDYEKSLDLLLLDVIRR